MKFKSSVVFGATALTNVSNVLTANISISHTIYGVELRLGFRAEAAVPPSDHWFSPETEEVKQIMTSDPSRSGTVDTTVTTSDSGYRIRISGSRKVGKMDYKYKRFHWHVPFLFGSQREGRAPTEGMEL